MKPHISIRGVHELGPLLDDTELDHTPGAAHVISLWDPPKQDEARGEIDQQLDQFARHLPQARILPLYAIKNLHNAEQAAAEAGVSDRLHLWPDKAPGAAKVIKKQPNAEVHVRWLQRWWGRAAWEGRGREESARCRWLSLLADSAGLDVVSSPRYRPRPNDCLLFLH